MMMRVEGAVRRGAGEDRLAVDADLNDQGAVREEAQGELVQAGDGRGDAGRLLPPHQQLRVVVGSLRFPRHPISLGQMSTGVVDSSFFFIFFFFASMFESVPQFVGPFICFICW